jgi:uncharacterized protein (DUF2237 family)
VTEQEVFEAVAELHGINIEHPSSKAKAALGDKCPPYKYQHTNDLFALCRDIWQAAYAAGMTRAAEIIAASEYIVAVAVPEHFADAIRAEITKERGNG